jgi:hypothetical protein
MSFLMMESPSYAYPWPECGSIDGQACTQLYAAQKCQYTDEGSGCFYLYQCYCDRAFGPLQWRCGPNPSYENCPVSYHLPRTAPPMEFALWLNLQDKGAGDQNKAIGVPSACI